MTQQNSESQGGNQVRKATARTSQRSTTKRRTTRKVEIPAVESSNLPPRKKKSEALVLKHYRLRAADVEQTNAVVAQRRADPNDVVRKQYERGVNVDTALGAPGEDGHYGLYRGQRLAEVLRPDIDGLISFALNQGVVPTIIQEYRSIVAGLNETLQGLRSQLAALPMPAAGSGVGMQMSLQAPEVTAVTEIADEADGVLGMFFGGGETEDAVETSNFPS